MVGSDHDNTTDALNHDRARRPIQLYPLLLGPVLRQVDEPETDNGSTCVACAYLETVRIYYFFFPLVQF
jgi:hypothetical protein